MQYRQPASLKIFQAVLWLLACTISINVFAQQEPAHAKHDVAHAAAENFKSVVNKIDTLSAEFEQTLIDYDGVVTQETEGEFTLMRPGLFLWQVEPPFEQLVVSSLTTITVYDADLEQASIYPVSSLQNTPARLLSDDIDSLLGTYHIAQTHNKKSKKRFELTPISDDAEFEKVVFEFKKDKLSAIHLEDKLEQKTQIAFSRVKYGIPLDPKLFDFSPPEGTDIIVNE